MAQNRGQSMGQGGQRLAWADCARGLAILCVLVGHFCEYSGEVSRLRLLYSAIYSFHMPLFFVLSGLFFPLEATQPFRRFTLRRAKSLLGPYLGFCALQLVCELLRGGGLPAALGLTQGSALLSTLLAQREQSYFASLWFLPALFVAQCLFYAVLRLFQRPVWQGVACAALAAAGYLYTKLPLPGLPLNFEIGAFATLFLFAGSRLRPLIERSSAWLYRAAPVAAVFFAVATWYHCLVVDKGVDAYFRLYFSCLPTAVVGAVCGTLLAFAAAMLLQKCRLLALIGRESLGVYGLHLLLLEPMRTLLGDRLAGGSLLRLVGSVLIQTIVATALCLAVLAAWHKLKRWLTAVTV